MGRIKKTLPVKLFAGMIAQDAALFDACIGLLTAEYGLIDIASEPLPWNITDYYRDEMGTGLVRKFVFFDRLIDPWKLASVKLFTNSIEERFSQNTPAGFHRRLNIDPGYITEAKVVLASTKDYAHRISIGDDIYAEATLVYNSNERSFKACAHTYFDFRTDAYIKLFNEARDSLRIQLKRNVRVREEPA